MRTRLTHALGLALVALVAMTAAGCRTLKIEDGKLACGDKGECPSGYQCRQSKCYRIGAGDGGAGTGGHAGSRDAGDAGDARPDGAAGTGSDAGDGGPAGDGGTPENPPVTVTIQRNGNGTVQGPGVDCKDASCVVQVPYGTDLVLQAIAGADSRLEAWSGCASTNGESCALVKITQPVQVTATFALKNANLIVVKDGNGTGTVTATWTGGSLDCGTVCSAVVPSGTVVTLQATPGTGATVAWGASCGAGPGCTVTAGAQPTTVTATFTLSKVAVTVARTGSGTVMGPGGSCVDASCPFQADYGGSLTLTAIPGTNADLGAWTGCTTTNGATCTITGVTAPKQLQVAFTVKKIALTIQRSGKGKITNAAGTINCTDPTCVVQVDAGATVVIQAVPDADSQFSSWAGCTTTTADSCTIAGIAAAAQVSATFALKNASFVISRQGNATGTVKATWTGGSLDCGATCSANIPATTVVTLQGTPQADATLTWGTPCSGAGACQVTIPATGVTLVATFTLVKQQLTIQSGGGGTVTGTGGITCATFPCNASLDSGTSTTLTAVPAAEYDFAGWAGCTSSTGTACTVSSIKAATTVTASFTLKKYPLTIQISGNGTVTGTGISCATATCVSSRDSGSSITLTAAAGADSNFGSWTGCTSTTGTMCTVSSIKAAATVTATFTLKSASFTIVKGGTGAGTVTASWAGGGSLSCGTACSASILPGTNVTLTAAPQSSSDFAWGGACTGTPATSSCVVAVAAAGTTVNATFTLKRYLLSVSLSGPASSGSVLSTTSGVNINCGATCSALVDHGTVVALTGSPAANAVFSSWTGCTPVAGTPSSCTITVTAAATVTAAFKLNPGAGCASAADCRLGFCVNNICCGTACPANECTTMCQAGTGTCLYKSPRTACGTKKDGPGGPDSGSEIYPYCDGAGKCAWPKIRCDMSGTVSSCDMATQACCNWDNTYIPKCTNTPSSCGPPSEGDTYLGFSCGQAADCPMGMQCCNGSAPYTFSLGHWARCKAACDPNYDTTL